MDFSLRKFLEISACFHWVSIGNSTLLTFATHFWEKNREKEIPDIIIIKISKKNKKEERHEHKMSTNHHFQKTLVLRNSTPLTFWIIYSNLRNYVEKSIWGLRLRVASTSWCSGCSPSPNSNYPGANPSLVLNQFIHIIICLVGMGARHTGGIELRHCDVSPGGSCVGEDPRGTTSLLYVACNVGYLIT